MTIIWVLLLQNIEGFDIIIAKLQKPTIYIERWGQSQFGLSILQIFSKSKQSCLVATIMLCADISIVAFIKDYQNANIYVNVTWAILSL